jgi:uncharacterized membrane protein
LHKIIFEERKMATCTKCGMALAEGAAFCNVCGAQVVPVAPTPAVSEFPPAFQLNNTPPVFPTPGQQEVSSAQPLPTAQPLPNYGDGASWRQTPNYAAPNSAWGAPQDAGAQDVQQNKFLAVLSYIGPLALVPWLAAPNSKFARFHAKEGIKLLLAEVAFSILRTFISFFHIGISNFAFSLAGVAVGVFAIIGIINAAKGEFKGLPLLDKISLPFLDKNDDAQ